MSVVVVAAAAAVVVVVVTQFVYVHAKKMYGGAQV